MKSERLRFYFKLLQQQRTAFYQDPGLDFSSAWKRPFPEKWSIGETLYHLTLMMKFFRKLSVVYIPIILPYAHLRKKKRYPTETHDIYEEYKIKKKRPMKAPFLLNVPSDVCQKWNIDEVKDRLEMETSRLQEMLFNIKQDIAGQIYYPDPIAGNPNLIQCVHLLAIHEQHHFRLTKNYYEQMYG